MFAAGVDAYVSRVFYFTTNNHTKQPDPAAVKQTVEQHILTCSSSTDYANATASTCALFRALTGYFYFHLSVFFPQWVARAWSAHKECGKAAKAQ